jgi:hypothetical protein
MADFSKVEVVNTADGGATLIFDLDDETIKELEDAIGIPHTSPDFAGRFQAFVEAGLHAYLMLKGGLND